MALRRVVERTPLGNQAALLDALQQHGYAINRLIGAYEEGTFTPTASFATPGDLSVSYAERVGTYWRTGALVFVIIDLNFTPTFTSASGALRIGGLPYAASAVGQAAELVAQVSGTSVTWPTGRTHIHGEVIHGQDVAGIVADGSGAASANFAAANFSSGSAAFIRLSGVYPASEQHP